MVDVDEILRLFGHKIKIKLKSEDQITGHRFEISSNGFFRVIGNRLVRALKVVSEVTGDRKFRKNRKLTEKQ